MGQEGAAGAWFGCGPVVLGGLFLVVLVWRAQPLALMASAGGLCRTASHWAFVSKRFRASLSHLLLISVYGLN